MTVLTGVLLLMAAGTANSFAQEKAEPAAPEKTDQPEAPAKPEADKPAGDEKTGPAYELLNSAATVLRNAKSLTYTAKSFGTESMESMSPRTTAQVWMLRDQNGTWLLRAKGSGKDRSGADQEFDVAWRRETVEYLDHKEKKVYERRTREARSSALQIASASRVADLVGPNPYNTLVSAQTLELEDRQSIDGVDCDVLLASSGTKKSKSRWYFGVEDHLPRKVEKIIEGDKIAGMIVVEFSAFTVSTESASDTAVTPEQVRVEVPASYASDRYQPRNEQDSKPSAMSEAEAAKAAEQAAAAPNPFLPGPPPRKNAPPSRPK